MRRLLVFSLLLLFGLAPAATEAEAQTTQVDLALSLLVDVSGSIDASEYAAQKTGYVNAFTNPALWTAINDAASQGGFGQIVVQYVEWSSASQQIAHVGWTLIDSEAAMNDFAQSISSSPRLFNNQTAPQSAMSFGAAQFGGLSSLGYDATRWVMDVSGDGCANSGDTTGDSGRQDALNAGVDAINGLVILPESPTNLGCGSFTDDGTLLTEYYANNVVSSNGFLIEASGFDDFERAVFTKIEAEIRDEDPTPVPEPASMLLLGSGLLGLGFASRRRRSVDGDA